MDRETLMDAVQRGPVEISMNDGQKITIPGIEFCVVDDVAAHILYRAEDGSWKTRIAAMDCMTTITLIESSQSS